MLWEKTAAVAFGGNNGALDEGKCVAGSVSSKEQQTGRGESNPSGTTGDKDDKKDAAAGLRPAWSVALTCGIVAVASFVIS
jgi:hypothetical protein